MPKRRLLVLFCCLNLADLFITLNVVNKCGIEFELNPVARLLAINLPVYVALPILKVGCLCGGSFLYHLNYRKVIIAANCYYGIGVAFGLMYFLNVPFF